MWDTNRYTELLRASGNLWENRNHFWALPLGVFKLPCLWVSDVQAWLADQGIPFQLKIGDRPLHGCLLANKGRGCILLNGTDDDPELRFSLAHEVSHFLLDYHLPRQAAMSRLGPSILEVFDGYRPASIEERVHAVLGQVSVGFHSHLMERPKNGVMGCDMVMEREGGADRLALELLAPEREVRRRVAQVLHAARGQDRTKIASQVLQTEFGLPSSMATLYGRFLYQATPIHSVRQWLQQKP